MSSQDPYDRGEWERERGDWDRERRERECANDGGERRSYGPPTCFACQEVGHYTNQCPNRNKRYSSARPLKSTDSRRSRTPKRHETARREPARQLDPEVRVTIAKLGKSVAAMEEYYATEREKKELKVKRKLEKEEAQRRAEEEAARVEEERIKAEKKAWKRKQKKLAEEERRAEMQKDLQVQLAIHVGDMEDRLVHRLNQLVSTASPLCRDRGMKKVTYVSDVDAGSSSAGSDSDTSVTQELSARAERLTICEKRKWGLEPVFEDPSPPMEQPAKCTPRRGILKPVKLSRRLTRSKSKKGGGGLAPTSRKKKATRKRTPALTPQSKVTLERLRYRENVLRELKDLDATELQRICREEEIHYDKKIEAIFDIADHRTDRAFLIASDNIERIAMSNDTTVEPDVAPTDEG
ncbi:hypothetical protein CBR_g24447 [Chara braunii]|uniref:CCHC-type domain-containing protein n=1 Tax=Chara braunii TaxID=69332 RepID=A0A388JMS2_CHABU|nr:hypothetical protein CBR_g24447 [Chara braunii]|eukprot:GBG59104.1 hypothetical protein CBR_g24447 [Chara braunii]